MAQKLLLIVGLAAAGLAAGCANMMEQSARDARRNEEIAKENAQPEPKPVVLPVTHFAAGQMLESKGDLAGAIAQYEKAVAADPRFVAAYNRLGIAHQKMGRFADAEKAFRLAIQVEPGSATVRNNLGYHYLLLRKYPDAERELRAALSLKPGFSMARMNLGVTLAHTGRFNLALQEFKRVVPEETAHFNIGVICLERLDAENAREAFKRALACNPECPGAKEQLDRLDRLAAGAGTPVTDAPQLAGQSDGDTQP